MRKMSKNLWLLYSILVLICMTLFVIYVMWQDVERGFTFAVLDVGQGDALFVESPTGTQVMFDAGPEGRVMGELSKVMPFYDRTIDAIVITNPDADHIGGFLSILKNYKVGTVFEPGTFNESKIYKRLEAEIKKQNIRKIVVRRGMRVPVGAGAEIDFLFPDRDVSKWDANDGSVVARVTYGESSIMLTGDATQKTEKIILTENNKDLLDIDILKIGHHGSRTSTSREFVEVTSPDYAVISDGEGNKYGHPHQETLDTLQSFGTQILRTDLLGTIIFKCDKITGCKINK